MDGVSLDYSDPGTAFSLVGALYLLMAIVAGVHVVLNKQNEASAFSWLGIIVLAPLIGAVLYWLFGINRIRRRAQAELPDHTVTATALHFDDSAAVSDQKPQWQRLMSIGLGVHQSPYLSGNSVSPLINGDSAYPEMIKAIDQAQVSVLLSSYIFEYDDTGKQFVESLAAANDRGVEVRVLIDGLGVGYGFSLVRADRVLRRRGVRTARFLSTLSSGGTRFINLRNHRKILSVDGKVAFLGGMNIRASNVINSSKASADLTQDIHFKVQGPVVEQINAVFAADWQFAAGEQLQLPQWTEGHAGSVMSRVLLDGPDDNYKKLQLTMLGAIQQAQRQISIVSPYFLPDKVVLSALHVAALRGVQVNVCIPAKNNLRIVGWAMRANTRQLLEYGLRLFESHEPFDHSKLFVVDDYWCMIGSSNWDARSLELNFEINLECNDAAMTRELSTVIQDKMERATQVKVCVDRFILIRLRNNFFRLFSPYL